VDSHNFVSTLLSYCIRSHFTSNYTCNGAICLLAMTEPLNGVHPIIVREMLYQFTSCILCLHFCDAFITHSSPHQFKIATKGECE
jgi:hypothetical protein